MALSWTQDRIGPMCRYAEDCALVMAAIAKQDDRDLSVQDIPFNWDANLDITRLRVGYIPETFDDIEDTAVRAIHQATLDQLKALGVEPIAFEVPRFPVTVTAHNGRDRLPSSTSSSARTEWIRSRGRPVPPVSGPAG